VAIRTERRRQLLDAGLDPDALRGPEVGSHLEVALAVAAGIVDASLGVRSAAAALDLRFVPVTWEDYDLVLPEDALDPAAPLVTAVRSAAVRAAVAALGGYVVRLAGLRVRQGRLAEAAELLVGAEHDSNAVRPQLELHPARGEAELAAARAERFLRERGESELTAPVLLLLARAHLMRADQDAAAGVAKQLQDLAASRSSGPLAGFAEHAAGLVAAAAQDPRAVHHLESALGVFGRRGLPLEEARVRLDLAQVLAIEQPVAARAEARTALARCQALTATRDADAAMSLLRRLGVRGHSTPRANGPRGDGRLTPREQEVLDLLGHGLSNADIAARLYLSRRTVEHHVSNILAKLGLTTRTEATAHVARRPPP
jgi:DNA-binding CsgD family transcriptional regulator